MEIKKKAWPELFEKIISGEKTFDLRLADWPCHIGDTLVLQEFDPKTKKFTGREIKKQVTFVLKTKDIEAAGMWSKEEIDHYGFQIISLK